MHKAIIIAAITMSGFVGFVGGRESAPEAYIMLGSNSTIRGSELRNVSLRTANAHDVAIIDNSIQIDAPWWRSLIQ